MKAKTIRHKLSPKSLRLPSGYRTTAWAEIRGPWLESGGRFDSIEIARFHSSAAGQVEVYAAQWNDGIVKEISAAHFFRFLAGEANLT